MTGCGLTPPETGAAPSARALAAGYPDLLTEPELAAAVAAPEAPAEVVAAEAALAAEAARLRARAAALSGTPVLSVAERARLDAAAGGG